MNKAIWRTHILAVHTLPCLYPEPRPMTRTRWFWLALGLVTLAAITFSAFFIAYLTAKQGAFQTNAEDFGIMDQSIWSTLHGQVLHQTICNIVSDTNCYSQQGIIRFALHFEPILLPISLLYFIWSDPRILIILQTLVVASGAYPAFLLARLRLRNEFAAVAIALVYLLYPAQQQATTFDFHAVTLTAALLLFVLYFLYTRQTLWLFIFAILAMACKEEISLTVALIGLWSLVFQLRWRSGLLLFLLGCIWFGLTFYIIMPHFSPTGHPLLLPRFEKSGGLFTYILTSIRHPVSFVQQNVLDQNHLTYLHDLFSPAGYVPLKHFSILYLLFLVPWILILALPAIAINLISSDPQMYSGLFQYNAEIVPMLIFSMIEALVVLLWCVKMVLLWFRRRKSTWTFKFTFSRLWLTDQSIGTTFLMALLVIILFSTLRSDYYFHGQMPFSIGFSWPDISVHDLDAQSMLNMIPPDASVSAQTKLVPHVSQRKSIYLFPYQDEQADYVLLDVTGDIYPYVDSNMYTDEIKRVLLNGHYGVLKANNGYLLLKRGLPAPTASSQPAIPPQASDNTAAGSSVQHFNGKLLPFMLPTSFCSNIYATPNQVTHPLQGVFTDNDGEQISLIGFDTNITGQQLSLINGYVFLTTYWRVPVRFSEDLQILYIIDGSDGKEYLASTDAPSLLWCPSATWKAGAIVQINSRIFSIQASGVPKGLAHMSIALLPQVQSSSTIMNVQARLSLRVVNAPYTVSTDPKTNVLQLIPLKIGD